MSEISFVNASQGGGSTTFYNSQAIASTSGTPSNSITSAVTDAAADVVGCIFCTGTASQTIYYNDIGTTGYGGSYNLGSSSVTFTWAGSTGDWGDVATAIKTH
jgi:hypothetical protein